MAKHEDHMGEDHYNSTGTDAISGESCNSPSCFKQEHLEHLETACGTPASIQPNSMAAMSSPAAKRRAASEFIQATTGVFLPFSSDQAFRAGLKDGVLLCRMANTVFRGGIQYLECTEVEPTAEGLQQQMHHNLSAFINAVEERLQELPDECKFSISHMTADGAGEHPQVSNCILFVRSVCSQQNPQQPVQGGNLQHDQSMPMTPPSAARGSPGSRPQHQQQYLGTPPAQTMHAGLAAPGAISSGLPLSAYVTPQHSQHPALVSPGYGGYPSAGMLQQMQHRGSPMHAPGMSASPLMDAHSSLTHGASHSHAGSHGGSLIAVRSSTGYGSSISAATHKSVQAAAGVTKLMQQCTNMLKERMFPVEQQAPGSGGRFSPAGPDSAMKALGPVLEGVLGHLTEEYEKRLLAKDHDLSKMQDAKSKMEKELERLKEEVQQLQNESDSRSAAVAHAAAEAAEAEVATLKQQLSEANAALDAKQRELASARALLDSADKTQHEEMLRLQVDCMRLREELDGLRDLHDRYKKVVDENRTLYNTVQDLRGNIRVFCRIRPAGATGDISPNCVDVGMDGELAIYDVQNGTRRMFKVDRIFDQHMGQDKVYEDTQPLIRSVLDGYNVCIFAYGQTGSGKTHTMSGTDTMHAEGRGINYRALDDLFTIRDTREGEYEYTFRVQMLEIYNESLRDLLSDGRSYSASRLEILATQASGCNVPGATQVDVMDSDDVAALMSKGASQRATSETKMNDRSSRSHQILTVIVDGVHKLTKARSHGCLHLIDLAGSERVSKSEASGDRLVEAQHINKSLSALGDVMAALASKDRHIPYRNSKLTQLLQDSLQGQAKVMMFMHVSPEANMFGESVSTLKFATRVSEITLGQAKKNVVSGKVFEAHEEAIKYQRNLESKEQQLHQLQASLHLERQQHQQEMDQMRQQLEEARAGAAAAAGNSHADATGPLSFSVTSAEVSGKQRAKLQLPIQQMLAAQQALAEAEAKAAAEAAESAADAVESAAVRPREVSSSGAAPIPNGRGPSSVRASAAGAEVETTGSPAHARPPIPTKIDRTPLRDQDTLTPLATARHLTPEHSTNHLHSLDYSSVEPTPRATPRSARKSSSTGLPPRESLSSQKHLERLQSARQYGSYRPSSGSGGSATTAATAAAITGSLSHRQLSAELSSTSLNLKEQASKLTARDGSTTARGSSAYGGIQSSRSARVDGGMPVTARTSGVVKSRVSEVGASSTMSMRQSTVYRGGSSAAGGSAAPSGSSTVRGLSGAGTSRGGSRWK